VLDAAEDSRFDRAHGYVILCSVSTVPEIIDAVKKLSQEQKNQFLAKLAEVDFDDAWDREIEADAKAGRLDFIWKEAQQDMAEGKIRPLDEVLGHE
jgi:SepF-like predicted cell division protein (DUF552 family)